MVISACSISKPFLCASYSYFGEKSTILQKLLLTILIVHRVNSKIQERTSMLMSLF